MPGASRATPALQERGIALGLFAEDPGFSYGPLLQEISRTGATHVSLVIPYYQYDVRSTQIYRHPRYSPPDDVVERTLRQARQSGLKVLLFPILRLQHAASSKEWRGSIRPLNAATWWESYTSFMLKFAGVARRHRCDVLCIGSELESMDSKPEPWAVLVGKVRQVFDGRLIYSANWDCYRRTAIWHLVDQVGLSAYFQLVAETERPTLQRLIHAWREQRVLISRWRARVGKDLVFTELGYHSQRGTGARPWDEAADHPVSMEEQAHCYEAFRRVWQGAPHLRGIYFWNWFGWGGPQSREYCPRGKPAAAVICRWFGAPAGSCPSSWGLPSPK